MHELTYQLVNALDIPIAVLITELIVKFCDI